MAQKHSGLGIDVAKLISHVIGMDDTGGVVLRKRRCDFSHIVDAWPLRSMYQRAGCEHLIGLFPRLPERTRLFRLFKTHHDWTRVFLAAPTVLGVIDTYGIELLHPIREGRSPQQIGRKGLSNHRWIVGGKLCLVLNQYGLIVAWDCATANVADNTFQWLIRQFEERMIILSDTGFHAAEGDPDNLTLCPRGEWQDRMLAETVLSMLTLVCHVKKVMHRGWASFQARLAFTMAAFNVLVQWHGFQPYASGFVPLSIAEFSL